MKTNLRVLSVLLTLVLLLSLLPTAAWAAPEAEPVSESGAVRGGGGGGAVWNSAFERENSVLGWQMIDADNDGRTFGRTSDAATGDWYLVSNQSYRENVGGQQGPDDYLISPRIELPRTDCEYSLGIEGAVTQNGKNVPYEVYVYTGEALLRPDNLYSLLGWPYRYNVFSWSDWSTEYMDLTAYGGQTIQIVLRCCSNNSADNALKLRQLFVSHGEADETLGTVTASNVPMPKVGVNVDTLQESDVSFPEFANYDLVPGSLTYYRSVGETFEELHNTVFRADENYLLSFQVRPKAGIEAGSEIRASVNGRWAQADLQSDGTVRVMHFNLPPLAQKKEVSEVNLRVAPPVVGTVPDKATERWLADGSTDYHYTVEEWDWEPPGTEVFQAGESYGIFDSIVLEEGYVMAEHPHFTVNGEPASALGSNELGEWYIIRNFPADYKEPIEAVDLYMYPLCHGDDPTSGFVCAQECASVWNVKWYSLFFLGEVPDEPMSTGREFFERGIRYRVLFGLAPNSEDQQFVPASRVTLNGTEAILDHVEENMYYYTADFKCGDPFWRCDFEGPWGFEGWSVIDANGDGNTFRYTEFTNQYDFTSSVVSLDQPVDPTGAHGCDDYLISPQITLPTGGQIELAVDQGGSGLEVYVYRGTEELNAENAERLLRDRIYSAGYFDDSIVMLWDHGYDLKYFEGQTVRFVFRRVSENGGSVKLDNVRVLHIPDGTLPVNFTATAMNVPTPKPGQTVAEVSDFTAAFPADAHYEMEPDSVTWYADGSIGYRRMDPDEVFAVGQKYFVQFGVLAKDGYCFFNAFANDLGAACSIDGEAVSSQFDSAGKIRLWKAFDRLESTVTVTFNAHGYGTAPEPVEIPAGKPLWSCVDPEDYRLEDTDGMVFGGWSRSSSDRKDFAIGDLASFDEDTTLYAIWLEELAGVPLYVDRPIVLDPINKPFAKVPRSYFFAPEPLGWWDSANGFQEEQDPLSGTFQPGKTYYGVVRLEPDLCSVFAPENAVSVIGATKVREDREEDGSILVTFAVTIPRRGMIDEVDLFVDIGWNGWLLHGTPPAQLCLTSGVSLVEGKWWENLADLGDESKALTDRFPAGCPIYTDAQLSPSLNCAIDAENLTVNIDGGTLLRTEPGANGSVHVIYSVWSPDYRGVVFGSRGSGWFFVDDDPHAQSWDEGPFFETGLHTVTAQPDPGWHFVGWYEGKEADVLVSTDPVCVFENEPAESDLYLTAVFEEGILPVDLVEIEVPIPSAGDSFHLEYDSAGAVVTNGAPVTVTKDTWYNEWGISGEPLTFEEGQNYFVEIELVAEPGYEITEDTMVRINGEDVAWKQQSNVVTWSFASRNYTMTAPIPIETVEIQAALPLIGDSFWYDTDSAGAFVTNDVPVEICEDKWVTDGGVGGNPLPFEEGLLYRLSLVLKTEPGYAFTDQTVIRINGAPADRMILNNAHSCSAASRAVAPEAPELIETLDIQIHHIPAAGETFDPDYDVVEAGTMAQIEWISTIWRDAEMGPDTSYPLTFQAGRQYYASFVIHGASGWEISDDTVFTIDGEPAAGWTRVAVGTYRVDSRAFTVHGEKVIPTVEVYANKPVFDVAPSEPYIPDYMPYAVEDWAWSDAEGNPLPKDFTVVGGADYTLTVMVKPEEGYMFSADEISVRLFWDEAEIVRVEPHLLTLRASCTAGMGTPNPFVDVEKGKFYYGPVLWAYYHDPQITAGTDATHFSPNKDCTRGQVVTFLWRAAGCPEPTATGHSFTDVKEGAYYYKAMLWAVENGITTGTSSTTFGPNKACTRAQVVTFLWRAAGCPEPKNTDCSFTDVKASASYYKAMLWAVEEGITTGTSATTFSPSKTCNRGQVVTFLYRAYGPKG